VGIGKLFCMLGMINSVARQPVEID